MITATLVKDVSKRYTGRVGLYRLSEAVPYDYWNECERASAPTTEYVVVSEAVALITGPETYIFPADADGDVLCWTEMRGSFRGALDQEEAIERAGWEVVYER